MLSAGHGARDWVEHRDAATGLSCHFSPSRNRARWAEHNRTVLARIAAATAQLAPIADGRERDARLQAEARIGRRSKPGCYRGEAYSETLAFPLKTS